MNKLLKEALEELTILHLHNGVQPSDLAEAMYEKPYLEFKITKAFELLAVELSFQDECEHSTTIVRMKYLYDLNKQLLRVDQKIGTKKFSTQWCRAHATTEAVGKVERALAALNIDCSRTASIISTLPADVKSLLRARLALVA